MQGNKSGRVFLLASLVLGVLATIMAFAYLDRTMGQQHGPTKTILAAAVDIAAGAAINPDRDLTEVEVPANTPGPLIEAANREGLRNQRTVRAIRATQWLLLSDLGELADLRIAPNMRAIAIPARREHALGGHLVPGDYVTLMVTRPLVRTTRPAISANPDNDDEGFFPSEVAVQWETSRVIDEPVKVLAVGSRLARQRQQLLMADQFESAMGEAQQTITLEVTEEQARTILEKSGAGQLPITLILHPPPGGAETR